MVAQGLLLVPVDNLIILIQKCSQELTREHRAPEANKRIASFQKGHCIFTIYNNLRLQPAQGQGHSVSEIYSIVKWSILLGFQSILNAIKLIFPFEFLIIFKVHK